MSFWHFWEAFSEKTENNGIFLYKMRYNAPQAFKKQGAGPLFFDKIFYYDILYIVFRFLIFKVKICLKANFVRHFQEKDKEKDMRNTVKKEAVKTETVKTEVKEALNKAANAVKETVKETEAAAEKSVKAVVEKKTEKKAVKAEKKPAVKKTAAAKTAVKTKVVFQNHGVEYDADEIMKKVQKAAAKKADKLKKLEAYVNMEENAVYYVVNGEAKEDYRIQL